jgi:hypothetical protein
MDHRQLAAAGFVQCEVAERGDPLIGRIAPDEGIDVTRLHQRAFAERPNETLGGKLGINHGCATKRDAEAVDRGGQSRREVGEAGAAMAATSLGNSASVMSPSNVPGRRVTKR